MTEAQRRSPFQAWRSRHIMGFSLLLIVLLAMTLISSVAIADDPELSSYDQDRELVIRRVETPTGEIIDLLPLQDTYITSGRPDQNYGSEPNLWIGYDLTRTVGAVERTYISWKIDDIPGNIIINYAQIWYYVQEAVPSGDASMDTTVRHLISPWNENTLTWNNASGIDYGSIANQGQIPASHGWSSVNVTDLVKDWMSGSHENYGVVILGDERVQDRERKLGSRTGLLEQQPFLRIDYTFTTDNTPPTASMEPFPDPIINHSSFTVSWKGEDPGGSGVDYYDVQYDAEGDGSGWINWLLHTTDTSGTFVAEDTTYHFRVRATDKAGNISVWSDSESIRVDATPPVSAALPFVPAVIGTNTFLVEWAGDDGANGTGIQYFNIYSRRNDESWQPWILQTVQTSSVFVASGDASYGFEVTAVDNIGNEEPFTGQPEAIVIVDTTPPFVVPVAAMPLISK